MVTERGVRYSDGHEEWESDQVFYPTVQRFAEWFKLELIEREAPNDEPIQKSVEKSNDLRERANRKHLEYLAAVKKSLDADAEKDSRYLAWADALDDLKLEETR